MDRPLTEKKRVTFLKTLSEGWSVSAACGRAEISRSNVYLWREKSPEFAAAWDRAIEIGTDTLEDEAARRARDGIEEPVFYKGVCVAHVRKYSDVLLMFLLNGRRPQKFRQQALIQHDVRVKLEDLVLGAMKVIEGKATEVREEKPRIPARRI